MNKKEKIRTIRMEMDKRLEAVLEHIRNCTECVKAAKWANAQDQMSKAEALSRNVELDLMAIRELAVEPPPKKAVRCEQLTFQGIDNWNRPIFQSLQHPENYFGSTDILFDDEASEADVLDRVRPRHLCFFGNHFGCEPMGTYPDTPLSIVLNENVPKMPKVRHLPPSKR